MLHIRLVLRSVILSLIFSISLGAKATQPASTVSFTSATVPQGEVTKHHFTASKIFPGTVRDYWIYVPRQYDPAQPACLYVGQDGVQFNAPAVFDRLIASREMPVTIGVFVAPGVVPALTPEALPRFNRSFEYDSMGDAYDRLLMTELLPDAEKQSSADGRPIRLSRKGADRAIGGASSGGICAFTAAWERPDAFSRVFSSIGTYVGLRGGNEYPTLIRKFEPKPIRVFLQDGSADQNKYAGDWWMANQEMERALTFAGYEVNHAWGTGGHTHIQANEIFADAMRWLWKGWPAPVKAGAGSPELNAIVFPGEDWQVAAQGYQSTAGLAVNAQGEVFFNDFGAGKAYKIGLDGRVSLFLADSKHGANQAFGPDGRLYTAVTSTSQILATDPAGKTALFAEGIAGLSVVVRSDGSLYVTDPGRGRIWFITPGGDKRVVDTRLEFCAGIAMSPDHSLLYVTDFRTRWVYSYQIQPDGSLAAEQRYYHLHSADYADPYGLAVDRDGRLYVATPLGIQVCDQIGRVNVIIPTPNGKVTGLCFGGANRDTLFATCGDTVYKRKVRVKGVLGIDPAIKPATPKL